MPYAVIPPIKRRKKTVFRLPPAATARCNSRSARQRRHGVPSAQNNACAYQGKAPYSGMQTRDKPACPPTPFTFSYNQNASTLEQWKAAAMNRATA